ARALDDPDAFVRRRAAIAYARAVGEPAATKLLSLRPNAVEPAALVIALALSSSPVAIGEATRRLRDREVARAVDQLLASEDEMIQRAYRERIRPKNTLRIPVLHDTLLPANQLIAEHALALRDAVDPLERRRAAISLAQVPEDEAVRALA